MLFYAYILYGQTYFELKFLSASYRLQKYIDAAAIGNLTNSFIKYLITFALARIREILSPILDF